MPRVGAVKFSRTTVLFTATLIFAALIFWSFSHIRALWSIKAGTSTLYAGIFLLAYLLLVFQMVLCYLERPYRTTHRQQQELDARRLVVNVPVYNEDADALKQCLTSLLNQIRRPDCIYVVDDGSKIDYTEVRAWFETEAALHDIEARWERQANAGKRHAQGRTIANTPDADFYLTVDSDAMLTEDSVREGLKPFADPTVQSVAGIVLVRNRVNALTWLTDLWFVVGQLVDRSSMSSVGAVLVNSGALAFYRGELLRENLDGYLNETFFGRRIETSDDSLLTIYALAKGKAVQQPTAFSFTLMPEKWSHHRRQYLRWMRGAFIRSWWRFRYLPVRGWAYWLHFIGWVQMAMATVTFLVYFIYMPVVYPPIIPYLLIIPIAVGYGQATRFFMLCRKDTPLRTQLLVYLATPVLTLYCFFVLRALRWYAMFTCLETGWGTRQQVESLTVSTPKSEPLTSIPGGIASS
jgi:hyaluronan synthase